MVPVNVTVDVTGVTPGEVTLTNGRACCVASVTNAGSSACPRQRIQATTARMAATTAAAIHLPPDRLPPSVSDGVSGGFVVNGSCGAGSRLIQCTCSEWPTGGWILCSG